MEIDFTGKVVLVTGASAGIGEAIALLLAKCGATLAIVGRNAARLHSVAERCHKERNIQPLEIVADLATDAGCEATAKKTIDHFKRLDVLVNNAAAGARTCIQHADMATFDRVFTLDVRGVYNLTRLLVQPLIEAKGHIINISSIAGSAVGKGSLPYGMAKVSKFVQTLTGYTDEEYAEWLQRADSTIPMGRVCSSEDIARVVAMVASPLSSPLTGTIIPVDGGLRFNIGGSDLIQEQMK